MQLNQPNFQKQQDFCACCYFFQNNKKSILPIMQNKYNVLIKNKFAQIKSVQKYKNPFNKNLQIQYSIPVDPCYVISSLIVKYQDVIVSGCVKQRAKINLEYKQAKQKGQTVMMAATSKNQNSVLDMKIGNIQPGQTIEVQFTLIGELKCELQNQWTLRIPSHIGPRYQTQIDLIQRFFQQFQQFQGNFKSQYLKTRTSWDFSIILFSSYNISSYQCSHQLKTKIISPNQYHLEMNGQKVPQIDLQLTYSHSKPQSIFCTLGNKCAAITFCTAPSQKSNFQNYKGQYIFLLDRSGSMGGSRIKQACQALDLFLRSLPPNSYFNIISFGSDFTKMYPTSLKYNQQSLMETAIKLQSIQADMGGTQIAKPLQEIYQSQKNNLRQSYQKNVIVLTDGQVSNTSDVIKIIKTMNEQKIAFTHMVGIGNGVSYSMIQEGAKQGGGQSLFIMNSQQLKRQIIFLLESIVMAKIQDFKINSSNQQIVDMKSIIVPKSIRKGREVSIFIDLKQQITSPQVLKNITLSLSYEDVEQNNSKVHYDLKLEPDTYLQTLSKYKAYLQIQDIISTGKNDAKAKAIEKSMQSNVLCKYTGFICRIKESIKPQQQKQGYVLKIRNALQGRSELKRQYGQISVKTLTGRSVQFTVPMDIYVQDLKSLLQQVQGIPVDQQRMVYAGKQLENGRLLSDYNMQPGDVVHLVLRLRGGDGGGSDSNYKNNLWTLNLMIENKLILNLPLPLESNIAVLQIYNKIYQKYNYLSGITFTLINKQQVLDRTKTLKDYGIDSSNNEIKIDSDAFLFDLFKNLMNLMQFEGFWEYDQKIINLLNLKQSFQKQLKQYDGNKRLAMTKCMINFLTKKFAGQKDEISLIIKKANKYIQKNKVSKVQQSN